MWSISDSIIQRKWLTKSNTSPEFKIIQTTPRQQTEVGSHKQSRHYKRHDVPLKNNLDA